MGTVKVPETETKIKVSTEYRGTLVTQSSRWKASWSQNGRDTISQWIYGMSAIVSQLFHDEFYASSQPANNSTILGQSNTTSDDEAAPVNDAGTPVVVGVDVRVAVPVALYPWPPAPLVLFEPNPDPPAPALAFPTIMEKSVVAGL